MVKQLVLILTVVCLILGLSLPSCASDTVHREGEMLLVHDSILGNILTNVSKDSKALHEYEAEVYVRGLYRVPKRNELIRFVPSMFRFYKDVDEYLTEVVGEMHYTAPALYDMKVRALTGTFRRNRAGLRNSLEYLHMNIYSPTLLPDRLLSPLDSIGLRYYTYLLDSVSLASDGVTRYHISIVPRNNSLQLVSGSMVVRGDTWTVADICLQGQVELAAFKVKIQMGEEGAEAFLPKHSEVSLSFRFLGSRIEADYAASFDYRLVRMRNTAGYQRPMTKQAYDLSSSYRLKCDDSDFVSDTAYMAAHRPFPLTEHELQLYAGYYARRQQRADTSTAPKRKSLELWGEVGDALISSYTIDLSELGRVRCSPLINPFLISYSHSNGFSYRQEFKYNRIFPDDKWIRIVPKLGYNFTRNEFYWSVGSDYYYAPSRLGALAVKVGNGNRIYTSRVLDEIKDWKDSLIDFSKLHLDYFKDMYVQVENRYELTNGLLFSAGLSMHWRKAVRPSELPAPDTLSGKIVQLRPTYVSFAPRFRLSWTPGQYFYMNGHRKIPLYSRYPTFTVDYERGIKGVFGSNGSYERIETDVQQRIRLTPMRSLFWRIGSGAFTNQNTVYFVDFENFSRNNLPVGWNDDIGGVFHLLDGEWYNSSRWYARGHVTYEAPFLVFPHKWRFTRAVDSERLYLGILHTNHLHPYIEMGYGIGTHIFDFGLFVSNINGKFNQVGCKFTFELFNRS